jgi:RNA polymerase sigma-70 factor (ECF subfamily)
MPLNISQFYEEHFRSVYNYVYFRVRNVSDTEDIVSNVFLKVVEHADTYRPQRGATSRSWLFAIVRNTITDHFRTQRPPNIPVEEAHEVPGSVNTANEFDHTQLYASILIAVDHLPERQREIVILRYQSELRNKEIAAVLNIDERTVAATLTKAKQALRTTLPKHSYDVS